MYFFAFLAHHEVEKKTEWKTVVWKSQLAPDNKNHWTEKMIDDF